MEKSEQYRPKNNSTRPSLLRIAGFSALLFLAACNLQTNDTRVRSTNTPVVIPFGSTSIPFPTDTATYTLTPTSTVMPSETASQVPTALPSATATLTETATNTSSPTATITETATATPLPSATATATEIPATRTPTPTEVGAQTTAEPESCATMQNEIELATGFSLQLNNEDCLLHNSELLGTANLNGLQRIFMAMYFWDNGGQANLQRITDLLSYGTSDEQIPDIYDDIGDALTDNIWANNETLGRATLMNYVNGLLPAESGLEGTVLNGRVQVDRSDYLNITTVIDNWLAEQGQGHTGLRNAFRLADTNLETAARDASFAVADSAGVNINFIKLANIEGHMSYIGSFSPLGSGQRYRFVFDATSADFNNINFSYSLRYLFDAINDSEDRTQLQRVYADTWSNLQARNLDSYSNSANNNLYRQISAAIPGNAIFYRPVNTMISQVFGRHNPIYPNGVHEGTDFAGGGVEFIAPYDCIEVNVFASNAYGPETVTCTTDLGITIDGENYNLTFFFAHADRVLVTDGQSISRGTPLGFTGNQGERTTGPHLHYGVAFKNSRGNFLSDDNGIIFINPEMWVPDINPYNSTITAVPQQPMNLALQGALSFLQQGGHSPQGH